MGVLERLLLALLVGVSAVAGTVDRAGAFPVGQEGCTFAGGFAAFREAVGEKIVGTCEGDQTFEPGSNARQRTSTGSFYFDARLNRVIFQTGIRTWMSGATGINHEVTVAGLGDGAGEPLVAPAAAVLNLALIQPGHLGPRWTDAMLPRYMPDFTEPDCSVLPDSYGLPSFQTSLVDQEHSWTVGHKVSAVPDWAIQPLRPALERFAAACEGWTGPASRGASSPGEPSPHFSLEPFVTLGDESVILKIELVQAGTGTRRTLQLGIVRYGGLTSTMMLETARNESDDEVRGALEWLAQRVDDRLNDVARALRK